MSILKHLFNLGKDEKYEEAMKCFNEHDFRGAVEKFENILKTKTSSKSLHYNLSKVYISQSHRNLGIILFAMGNYSEALKEFNMALEFNQDYHELNYFIGVCLNNLGDFDGAIKSFIAVLDADPANLPARLKLGIALHNYKMWDKAIALYKNILKANPKYADIHYNLGLSYLGQGKIDEAKSSFEDALEINANYLQAKVKIAISNIFQGRLENALDSLLVLSENYPNYADIHYYLGIVYSAKNEIENALESFRRAIKINPAYKDARIKLATLYCYFERIEEGIKELEEVKRLDPEDKDISIITCAIKSAVSSSSCPGENFMEIYQNMLFKDKQVVKTMPEFNRGVSISPDMSDMITIIMSISEEDRSLCEMLIPYVKDHVSMNEDYPDLHNSLGMLYLKVNRYEEAEVSFKKAVELNPNYLKARINLFHTLKILKKYEDAIKEGEYILSQDIAYPDFHCVMAELYLALKEYDKALVSVFKALNMNPQYSKANCLAGDIYKIKNDHDKAAEYYNRCLKSNPTKILQEMAENGLSTLKK
ncbi:MAG: Lipopolysaccharide assembly protein B [Syntrophorhabdaceae bacterium]|jgi:tetratricopeptide (TPR) repeat protein|nr:Lipopolysaccharide assembly protein B [Syntrophorhabdaceae bacterium]HNQ64025.1 tetratricopeptide repeat protein [Syntrophorhabdaceae bacterium]HNZ59516.1 tetratricopeptide repeat protein [Syntrophorhabdaceae bacterium]